MRAFHSIRRKVTFAYLIVVLLSISSLGLGLTIWTENHYVSSLRSDLVAESQLLGRVCTPYLDRSGDDLNNFVNAASKDLGRRITIVRSDGKVLGDSASDYHRMESHLHRTEIQQALHHSYGWSIRKSATIHSRLLYVATAIEDNGHIVGFARVAESLVLVDTVLGNIKSVFLVATLIALIVAAFVAFKVSSAITTPILAMSDATRRFQSGDMDYRIAVPATPRNETDELAVALNSMAGELSNSMKELSHEKSMLETILNRTDDGLLVVDADARVIMSNPAAHLLLGLSNEQVLGRKVIEGTLSHDLSELVARVLRTISPASLEIELSSSNTYVNVYVAPLGPPSNNNGAVIVMHDISSAKKIDAIRRDFVANVSHELRTPLAAVKAMAETIVLRGRKDPSAAENFGRKIMSEADRLTAISEDLLDLARIESGLNLLRKKTFCLNELAENVVADYVPIANQKNITLSCNFSGDLLVSADADSVNQILVNLVDNAVKYTPVNGSATISGATVADRVAVKVSDTGIGIPAEDQPRIFERFYRVDKARSRESGGTGLGLSIVKHLVEANDGRVTLESSPDKGSTFTFTLPKA